MDEELKQEILNVRKELFDMKQNILHPEWIHKVGLMIDKLDIIVSRVGLPSSVAEPNPKFFTSYFYKTNYNDQGFGSCTSTIQNGVYDINEVTEQILRDNKDFKAKSCLTILIFALLKSQPPKQV